MINIDKIIQLLNNEYPDVMCTLDYKDPLELLIATQLAAQCTDKRVNMTTPELFSRYHTAKDFADADIDEIEKIIRPTGFYHNKARNIVKCCEALQNLYNGIVPDNMDDLVKLPGVGRKTANVILGEVFGKPAVIVDTHTKRLSNRIGLSKEQEPEKIEKDLMKLLPVNEWTKFCHRLVFHGRQVCDAKKPDCHRCCIKDYCEYNNLNNK
jgi:endonuclease-3